MAKIIIIGAGVMSCAFSVVCLENNHQTYIIGSDFDNELIDEIMSYSKKYPHFINQIAWLHASKALSQKWPCK